MATPTWDGWPEVLAKQKEDVESTCPDGTKDCLFRVPWFQLTVPDWKPDMESTGIQWNTNKPGIEVEATFALTSRISAKTRDLWTPVGEEDTNWNQVIYPR